MKYMAIMILLTTAILVGGCQQPGMVSSGEQRTRRIAAIRDLQDRQIVDDSDMIWLFDENLHLSEWQAYVGQ